ncbi:zinc ribbon domain-containing protein [Methanobrevibacter sp. YE315]|uniref:zinc ribbon domain-containing protein n=1 Tax=Methanobrevibacter sp. YE315 TaxID=1609968 RepID=UPI0009E92D8B|nr:zinc ribbon domain-containing protein [Methanobrevibacter sp. YE315]
MANKICPRCGTEQDEKFKFCKNCGALLSSETNENINITDENNYSANEKSPFDDFIKEEKEYSEAFINEDINTGSRTTGNANNKDKAKICPMCGEKVENENFCSHCGTKINVRVKRCVNCGTVINSAAKICPNCGYNIIQKVPILAAALSFIFPGLGQLYNNQNHKGIILIIANVISLILIFIGIGFIFMLIIWVYAIYDAFMSAKAIDRGEPTEDKLLGF